MCTVMEQKAKKDIFKCMRTTAGRRNRNPILLLVIPRRKIPMEKYTPWRISVTQAVTNNAVEKSPGINHAERLAVEMAMSVINRTIVRQFTIVFY